MRGPAYAPAELLARLVAFDTTSHKSNVPLVRFVEDYLAQHGVGCQLVPTPDGAKASLFATIGPPGVPGLRSPAIRTSFRPTARTGRAILHAHRARGSALGRGSADMKGFLACVLAAVPDFARRRLGVPIHLAFSYDEEIGCIGVRPLLAELGRRLPRPRLVVVGEPTSMGVVDAHKGPVRWRIEVRGRAAHSSMATLGVNAITYAGRLLVELDEIERELAATTIDRRFDPPFATLQVTRIEGGTATNIVPSFCRFDVEVRALPGLDVAGIERRLRSVADALRLAMTARAPRPGSPSRWPTTCRRSPRSRTPRRCAGLAAHRPERDAGGVLRHRSRALPGRGRACGRVRSGLDRAGAHGQRVDRDGRARPLHGLPRPSRRLGRGLRRGPGPERGFCLLPARKGSSPSPSPQRKREKGLLCPPRREPHVSFSPWGRRWLLGGIRAAAIRRSRQTSVCSKRSGELRFANPPQPGAAMPSGLPTIVTIRFSGCKRRAATLLTSSSVTASTSALRRST